jgi:hypothetical protein
MVLSPRTTENPASTPAQIENRPGPFLMVDQIEIFGSIAGGLGFLWGSPPRR